jgi:hypothetical protein
MIEGYIKGARNTLTLYRKNKREMQRMSLRGRVSHVVRVFCPRWVRVNPVRRVQKEE